MKPAPSVGGVRHVPGGCAEPFDIGVGQHGQLGAAGGEHHADVRAAEAATGAGAAGLAQPVDVLSDALGESLELAEGDFAAIAAVNGHARGHSPYTSSGPVAPVGNVIGVVVGGCRADGGACVEDLRA